MNMSSLLDTLLSFSKSHVVVLGDVMLDRFVFGDVGRISPEAPIPVMRVSREESMLGGAGNVARNVVRMGGTTVLVSALGDDETASAVISAAAREPRLTSLFERDPDRRTIIKTRFVSQGQQLLRVDEETPLDVNRDIAKRFLTSLQRELKPGSVLVCSDYAKGVLTDQTVGEAIKIARERGMMVVVDPKGRDYRRYSGCTVITPNAHEAAQATGIACEEDEGVVSAARAIAKVVNSPAVVITRGAKGMTILSHMSRAEEIMHLTTQAREIHDVSGAGDTVIAAIAMALATGASLETAARLANFAAGVAVGKVGTAAVETTELMRAVQVSEWLGGNAKVVSTDVAATIAESWRSEGKKVVFTNGCFDLLHPGHIRLLERAKAQGDRLIVALNSDESVSRLKGPSRPIQSETARATVMASIGVVDIVTVFGEDTPMSLIEAIRPDVLVKGADYTADQVVGADVVGSYGGRVVLVDIEPGHSTTGSVRRAMAGAP